MKKKQVKETKEKSLTASAKHIKMVIEKLGKIVIQQKDLTRVEKLYKEELKEIFELNTEYFSTSYVAKLIEKVNVKVNPTCVLTKLKNEEFLEVITVNKTKLADYLSKKEIMECEGESMIVKQISIKKKGGGGN